MDIFIILASILSIVIIFFFALSFTGISNEVFIPNNLKNKFIEVGTNYGDQYLLTQNLYSISKKIFYF